MSKQELYAKVGSLEVEVSSLNQENKVLKEELEYQKFIVEKLQRMMFGSTSEKVSSEQLSNQMSLFNDRAGKEEKKEAEKEVITYERHKAKKAKKTGGRIPLPENLPTIAITLLSLIHI